MSQQAYAQKLLDPRWQKKRLEVMQRDNFACVLCKSKTRTLNVHHLGYKGDPWEAPMSWLETLCERCHELRPGINRMIQKGVAFIPSQSLLPILGARKALDLSEPENMGLALKVVLDSVKDQAIQIAEEVPQ